MDWGALHRSLEAEYRAGFAQGDLPRRPRCRCARSRAQVNNTCVVARSSMCKRPGACGECICSHAQWLLRAQTAGPAVPPTAPSSARWQEPGACKVPLLCLMCVLGVYPAVVGSHDCAHSSVFQILRDKATNLYTASGVGQQQRIVWSGSTATASGSGLRRHHSPPRVPLPCEPILSICRLRRHGQFPEEHGSVRLFCELALGALQRFT